ncbi:MAG: glycosyltransferase [Candidatus Eremiobacteraeota bacterium]|nr:glycosyltransferase [Candidatus Eremiobacteraeota bacterium]
MSWLWFVLLAVAAGYQLACALLCLAFQTEVRAFSDAGFRPGVSLLKPVRGWSQRTAANLATFEALTYDGPCQTVFTAARQGDPAVAALGSRVVDGTPSQGHNRKIAGLVAGVARAQHDLLVVSDADIRVSSDYLERVCAAFQEEQVGLVTSLYRASPASTLGAAFEALCIADFSASVLVARRTEGLAFALGATMAVRRQALEAIGGFQALEDYLADDFQLGYQVARAGWQVRLARTIVETDLGEVDLAGALSHQLRWMVTSRVSRPGGHAAFIVTQGLLWAMLLAASTGHWWIVPGWWVWRWLTTAVVWRALGARCRWWLLPLKEFAYLVLWVASLVTDTVRWGEDRYRIDRQGKMNPL